ncbi:short-chain dehydrogenase/reductase SDR [Kineococcus radiotolerans SRS30216 = ATCC BAA-149]|uniref:Short-chain dehydrogenase/reductase SDR n=1 Tax=Kineococcus radiotolerans (strain ATCC BAA-149 / DSM 14245 / SRS30216) TaxID=266940 RepID=A6WFX8_KINRD|nr:short-chain dehydrogenase/reductase SDR [Kineococcus radiotolerans SRS30216 = ATCC BAA-149]
MVLVTGVGRRVGIGAGIAARLARDGWDVATSHWTPYDDRMPWGRREHDPDEVHAELRAAGAATVAVPADLSRPEAPAELLEAVESALGPVTALVMAHAESVDSSILDTTVESFDRHFAVNARAAWLLIAEFARRFRGAPGTGRIVALTSDHTVHNLPYGASKGALDRIVLAAARELQDLRLTANVVNPGPVDTGWMDDELRRDLLERNPLGRGGTPQDTANLVSFLLGEQGGWINGQLLCSDGGWKA